MQKFKAVPLLSYSYDAQDASTYRERKLAESYTLSTCAMSGLPLGYFPTRKIAYQATLPFAQLSMQDIRHCITSAVRSEPRSSERVFTFFALLHKIPAQLLEIKHAQLTPQWTDARLSAMLTNGGLRNLTALVEAFSALNKRWLQEFPSHVIQRTVAYDNTHLKDLPPVIARWIGQIEDTSRKIKVAKYSDPISLRIFRRGNNAPHNPFAPTRHNASELTEFAKILADFYGRNYTIQWDEFVRNPTIVDSKKLRRVIQDVIAFNVRECDDDFSDEYQLSQHFRRWLEECLLRVEEQEAAASKMNRILRNDVVNTIAQMTEVNLAELVQKSEKLDADFGKPQRDQFKTFDEFVDALTKWKKSFAQKRSSAPVGPALPAQ